MEDAEWDFIMKMLGSYEEGKPWNWHDPTTIRVLRKFKLFIERQKDSL